MMTEESLFLPTPYVDRRGMVWADHSPRRDGPECSHDVASWVVSATVPDRRLGSVHHRWWCRTAADAEALRSEIEAFEEVCLVARIGYWIRTN